VISVSRWLAPPRPSFRGLVLPLLKPIAAGFRAGGGLHCGCCGLLAPAAWLAGQLDPGDRAGDFHRCCGVDPAGPGGCFLLAGNWPSSARDTCWASPALQVSQALRKPVCSPAAEAWNFGALEEGSRPAIFTYRTHETRTGSVESDLQKPSKTAPRACCSWWWSSATWSS